MTDHKILAIMAAIIYAGSPDYRDAEHGYLLALNDAKLLLQAVSETYLQD